MLLTACSSGGSGATESSPAPSSPTASAPAPSGSPSGSPAVDGPVASEVPGYRLEEAPPEADAAFSGLVSSSKGALDSLSTYTIFKDGRKKEIGGLVLFGAPLRAATPPDTLAALAPALVKVFTGGDPGTTVTVAGRDVTVASSSDLTVAAWFQGSTLSMVLGDNRRQVLDFVDASITSA